MNELVHFPAGSLLIVEERLKEHAAQGLHSAKGAAVTGLALRILVVAELAARHPMSDPPTTLGPGRPTDDW